MKKLFLSILVICSLLGGNAYAAGMTICGLKSDFYYFHGDKGYIEVKLYNPNNVAKEINQIKYYKGKGHSKSIDRAYELNHKVMPNSDFLLKHYTSKSYLADVTRIALNCSDYVKIENNSVEKNKKKKSNNNSSSGTLSGVTDFFKDDLEFCMSKVYEEEESHTIAAKVCSGASKGVKTCMKKVYSEEEDWIVAARLCTGNE